MEKEQIIEICKMYDDMLLKDGFLKVQERDEFGSLNHCRWMLNEIPEILTNYNKMEKANRWLGFVQGILWSHGYCDTKIKEKIIDESLKGKSFMMYGD